jgi:hypothetical protein
LPLARASRPPPPVAARVQRVPSFPRVMVSIVRAAPLLGLALLAAIYLPDAGLGFVKDDIVWIATSRLDALRGPADLFDARTGFFRPFVMATFTLDERLFGLVPRGYGVTNLVLLLLCVGATALLLARHVGPTGIAMAAALVWAFNFHGVNIAVLWLSGRTALCLCLWMAVAAWGFTRGARVWPVVAAALAMMSKEEAFVLPAILTGWVLIGPLRLETAAPPPAHPAQAGPPIVAPRGVSGWPARLTEAMRLTWPYWLAAFVLLAVRSQSGAMTPWDAPDYYRYSLSLTTLARNLFEYTDRAFTTAVAATLVTWLLLGRPSLHATDTRVVLRGTVWALLSLLPTLLLPSRSSLYALLPAIGGVMALAAVVDGWVREAPPVRVRRAVVVLLVLAVAAWPVYRSRNLRLANEARLSSDLLEHVEALGRDHPRGVVVVHDAPGGRPTAEQALGGQASLAAQLVTRGRLDLWIDDASTEPERARPDGPVVAELSVRNGVVTRTR